MDCRIPIFVSAASMRRKFFAIAVTAVVLPALTLMQSTPAQAQGAWASCNRPMNFSTCLRNSERAKRSRGTLTAQQICSERRAVQQRVCRGIFGDARARAK